MDATPPKSNRKKRKKPSTVTTKQSNAYKKRKTAPLVLFNPSTGTKPPPKSSTNSSSASASSSSTLDLSTIDVPAPKQNANNLVEISNVDKKTQVLNSISSIHLSTGTNPTSSKPSADMK